MWATIVKLVHVDCQGRENDMNNGLDLGGVDESLTDLQPADSDGEEDLDALWSRKRLTQEQKVRVWQT